MAEPTGRVPYRNGIATISVGGHAARAVVDTAGTALCLRQSLADDLGLEIYEWLDDDGSAVSVREPPELRVGDLVLDTEGLVAYGFDDVRPLGLEALQADLLLPASVLRRQHVVLDDPAGEMVVGAPGSIERRGVAIPTSADPDTGVILTSVEVDGEAFELVLDTALSCSLAIDGLLQAWQGDHPDWPASVAAVGPGNLTGALAEARVPMLRVPLVTWGPFQVPEVAFAWRGVGDVAGEGALGGNVLRIFRLDIDYTDGTVRVEQGAPFPDNDAELVGVVLAAGDDGWMVSATVSGLEDVRPGDVLLAVDGDPTRGRSLPDVLDLLRGTPGDRHELALRRPGEDDPRQVNVPVLRLL